MHFNLFAKAVMEGGPPLLLTFIVMRGQLYNPILAQATSHLSENCDPMLSLDGIQ